MHALNALPPPPRPLCQDDDMYSVCDPGALPSTYDMMRLGSCPSVFLRACENEGHGGGSADRVCLMYCCRAGLARPPTCGMPLLVARLPNPTQARAPPLRC